ncbi:MAG TPA: type II secretion system protein [Mycobacteriales bacterium]
MLERLRVTRDEEGFTLIEMMVALVVISIVFAASAGFLITSIKTQSVNERRVRATQVGNRAIEDLRALPWSVLGFYATDPGYQATVSGSATVTLTMPASGVRDSRAPLPGTQTLTDGGVTYQRTLNILWFDDPGDGTGGADADGDTHDAKLLRAALTWNVAGSAKALTVQGLRAPTIEEVVPKAQAAVNPFQVQSFAANPATETLYANGRTMDDITFTLHTTFAASQVRLSFVDRDNLTQTFLMLAPSSNTDWTYTLPAGAGPFDTGTHAFTARAYAAAGATADGTVNVSFNVSSIAFDISTPTVSPSSIDIDSSGRNTVAVTVTATATAPTTSMSVTYPTKSGNATATMNLSNGSTVGTYTIPALTGSFSAGAVEWTVTASGIGGTASRAVSVTYVPPAVQQVAISSLTVSPSLCAHNGNGSLNRQSLVYVATTGLASTDKVKLEFTDSQATKADASYFGTDSSGKLWFRASVAAGTMKWNTTAGVVTATATRYPDLTQTQRTFSVTVTFASGSGNCPA